mmetsp:Transcript_47088/g.154235  ORF Transcript_47088/g.154235 Transcript_47088/m.154235 type:complete len:201 (-) Transcript_47088:1123-1725(-)
MTPRCSPRSPTCTPLRPASIPSTRTRPSPWRALVATCSARPRRLACRWLPSPAPIGRSLRRRWAAPSGQRRRPSSRCPSRSRRCTASPPASRLCRTMCRPCGSTSTPHSPRRTSRRTRRRSALEPLMAPPPPPLCRPQWLIRSHAPIEHAQSYGARLEVGPSPCVRSHRTTRTPRYTACSTLTRNKKTINRLTPSLQNKA